MRLPVPQPGWPEVFRQCHHYDRLEVFGPVDPRSGHELGYARAYRERFQRTIGAVRRAAPPGASVLDIAAAQGNFSLTLAEHGYRVTWNDLRADLIPYVQAKHQRGEIHYAPGNAFDLEFPEPFDVVLCTEIIEHVAHPDRFLEQVATLVKPGGTIVLTTPNGAYWRNRLPRFSECANPAQFEAVQFKPDADGHIFLLHADEIRTMAAVAALQVQELSVFTNPLTRGALRLDRVLPFVPRVAASFVERVTAIGNGALCSRLNMQLVAVLRRDVPTSTLAHKADDVPDEWQTYEDAAYEVAFPDGYVQRGRTKRGAWYATLYGPVGTAAYEVRSGTRTQIVLHETSVGDVVTLSGKMADGNFSRSYTEAA